MTEIKWKVASKCRQKWPKVTKSDQKWPKVAKSDQKWPKVTKSDQKLRLNRHRDHRPSSTREPWNKCYDFEVKEGRLSGVKVGQVSSRGSGSSFLATFRDFWSLLVTFGHFWSLLVTFRPRNRWGYCRVRGFGVWTRLWATLASFGPSFRPRNRSTYCRIPGFGVWIDFDPQLSWFGTRLSMIWPRLWNFDPSDPTSNDSSTTL